jgi:hypothetical protein
LKSLDHETHETTRKRQIQKSKGNDMSKELRIENRIELMAIAASHALQENRIIPLYREMVEAVTTEESDQP